jgi:hypothetical protein
MKNWKATIICSRANSLQEKTLLVTKVLWSLYINNIGHYFFFSLINFGHILVAITSSLYVYSDQQLHMLVTNYIATKPPYVVDIGI